MKKSLLLLLLAFAVMYLLPLGIRPLMFPDEVRYAEIPREMIAAQDYIVPRLAGHRYFEKPVLGYWLSAAVFKVLGLNNWTARLPVALAALFSGLIVFTMMSRYRPRNADTRTTFWAALIFISNFGVLATGTFSTLDGLVALFLTACLCAYFHAYQSTAARNRAWFLFLSGVFAGLAFLTKGFLAFAVPVAVIVPFLIWEKQWRSLWRHPWLPLLGAAVVSLPWAAAVHLREPDFWNYFFWIEHVQRFTDPNAAEHTQPFWFFVPVALVALLPWSALIPAAVRGYAHLRWKGDAWVRFLVCWALFPFLFFSCSTGKLPTYVLPCFPAFVMLLALGLLSVPQEQASACYKWAVGGLILFFSAVAAALSVIQLGMAPHVAPYVYAGSWQAGMALILCMSAILILSASLTRLSWSGKLALFSLSWFPVFAAAPWLMPELSIKNKAPVLFLEQAGWTIEKDTLLVSESGTASALCLHYRCSKAYIFDSGPGELEYGLGYPDAQIYHLKNPAEFQALLERRKAGAKVLVFMRSKKWAPDADKISTPMEQMDNGRYVLLRF